MAEEASAAVTFDKVRDGMQSVMVVAHDRLRETREALEEGDFSKALNRLNEAQIKITALYRAETELGAFAGTTAIRGRDLTKGMEIIGEGVVTEVENVSEHGDDCPSAMFQLTLEDGEIRRVYAETELLVARSGD